MDAMSNYVAEFTENESLVQVDVRVGCGVFDAMHRNTDTLDLGCFQVSKLYT